MFGLPPEIAYAFVAFCLLVAGLMLKSAFE